NGGEGLALGGLVGEPSGAVVAVPAEVGRGPRPELLVWRVGGRGDDAGHQSDDVGGVFSPGGYRAGLADVVGVLPERGLDVRHLDGPAIRRNQDVGCDVVEKRL